MQADVRGGGAVAQQRTLAAGEHGREPPPLARELAMPDRVHATVDPVQPPVADAKGDGAASKAGCGEVGEADDAVLLCGKRGDASVRAVHVMHRSCEPKFAPHAALVGRFPHRCDA